MILSQRASVSTRDYSIVLSSTVLSQGDMEQKLAEYRARKAKAHPEKDASTDNQKRPDPEEERRSVPEIVKERLYSVYSRWRHPARATMSSNYEVRSQSPVTPDEVAAPLDSDGSMWKVTLLLKFLLWLVLLGLFVEFEFGLAYFLLSMFYWIYEGTRRPGLRKKGEKSAYSVFNPGCEAIDGTLTAEQFERELQYRPLAGI